MLVSEALGVGTPALCTDSCGAAALGAVVIPPCRAITVVKIRGIAGATATVLSAGTLKPSERQQIYDAATLALSPAPHAAQFLARVN